MLSVGDILREAREKKGLTLNQVEKTTRIRIKFLKAIEDNNWNFFSSKIYIVGLIKNYAKFIGLDTQKILAFFRRDYERKEDVQFKRRLSRSYLKPETRILIGIGIFLVFLFFFGYFGYQLKIFLTPPKVTIISPRKSIFRSVEKIHVIGKTEKESTITIYGEKVFQNKEGVFEYDFPMKKGKNELMFEVIGANGKKTEFKKTFTLE